MLNDPGQITEGIYITGGCLNLTLSVIGKQ